jgi:hypothetical protein
MLLTWSPRVRRSQPTSTSNASAAAASRSADVARISRVRERLAASRAANRWPETAPLPRSRPGRGVAGSVVPRIRDPRALVPLERPPTGVGPGAGPAQRPAGGDSPSGAGRESSAKTSSTRVPAVRRTSPSSATASISGGSTAILSALVRQRAPADANGDDQAHCSARRTDVVVATLDDIRRRVVHGELNLVQPARSPRAARRSRRSRRAQS